MTPTTRQLDAIRALIDNHEATDTWWSANWDCSGSPGHPGYPIDDIVRDKARAALASVEALLRECRDVLAERGIDSATWDLNGGERFCSDCGVGYNDEHKANCPYGIVLKKLAEQVPG